MPPMTPYIHLGGPLCVGIGSSTGAAAENDPNVGRSSESPPLPPPDALGPPIVVAAIARMSMSPEPSDDPLPLVTGADALGATVGIASCWRFASENSTEFSCRCAVRFSTRPPSWLAPGPRRPPPSSTAALDAACDAKRSPPPPRAAIGAPKPSS